MNSTMSASRSAAAAAAAAGLVLFFFCPSTKMLTRPEQDDVVTRPSKVLISSMKLRMGASMEPLGERSV